MSLLTPLYLLGAFSIVGPILFHLIRQQTKTQVPVSTLMFLQPAKPKVTRRSRLDDLPLLLLRSLVLLLVALAFARPFGLTNSSTDISKAGRQVIILIDSSASMRRENAWPDAQRIATKTIAELATADQFTVAHFDQTTNLVFESNRNENAARQALVADATSRINELQPSWNATRLDRALRWALERVSILSQDQADTDSVSLASEVIVHLISDLQSGSELGDLQNDQWPDSVVLVPHLIEPAASTNAAAFGMKATQDSQQSIPIRVMNDRGSLQNRFQLAWQESSGKTIEDSITDVEVEPGRNQVIRLPKPPQNAQAAILFGDDHEFDNTRYFVSPEVAELDLVVADAPPDARDPSRARQTMDFFVRRLPLSSNQRRVTFIGLEDVVINQSKRPLSPKNCPLVIVSRSLADTERETVAAFLREGGHVFVVLENADDAADILEDVADLASVAAINVTEGKVDEYALLSQIDFSDALFKPLSEARFNDFSKTCFWSYRSLSGLDSKWKIVASFESSAPAIIRRDVEQGSLWLMTAGWHPEASQFALSTKFVPLMSTLFQLGIRQKPMASSYEIGDETGVRAVDQDPVLEPGIVTRMIDGKPQQIAFNVPESESQTEPFSLDQLEQFGITIRENNAGSEQTASLNPLQQQRQLRHRELENRQQWWKFLLIGALALIGIETVWGGSREYATT